MYQNFFKRVIDILVSVSALLIFSPLLIMLTIVGAIVLKGNPFFLQARPGKKDKDGREKKIYIIKLRTMSNACTQDGILLPDDQRLGRYGKWLRSTSADELPSLICIMLGQLSLVGPRPQLYRDIVFMTEEQRRRHDVTPGLTGLAQVSGRNSITWELKLAYDLAYIDNGITFISDAKILFRTVGKVLKRSDVVRDGTESDMDFGDWLLSNGEIQFKEYEEKKNKAKEMLEAKNYA